MLKLDKETRTALTGICVVLLFVFALSFVAYDRQNYENPNYTPQAEQHQLLLGISPEGWTAIFTGLLTLSTIGLWIVTRQSVRIASRTLTDLERPYLYITTDGELVLDSETGGVFVLYDVTNHGRTPASIVGTSMSLGPAENSEPKAGWTQLGQSRLRIKPIVGAGKRRKDIKAWQTHGTITANPNFTGVIIETPPRDYAFLQVQIFYKGPFTQEHETLATWYFDTSTQRFVEYLGWDEKYNHIH